MIDAILIGAPLAVVAATIFAYFHFFTGKDKDGFDKIWNGNANNRLLEEDNKPKNKGKARKGKNATENVDVPSDPPSKPAKSQKLKVDLKKFETRISSIDELEEDYVSFFKTYVRKAKKESESLTEAIFKAGEAASSAKHKIGELESALTKAEKKAEENEAARTKAEKKNAELNSTVSDLRNKLKTVTSELSGKEEKKVAEKTSELNKSLEEKNQLNVQIRSMRTELIKSRNEIKSSACRILSCEAEKREALIKAQAMEKGVEARDSEILVLKTAKDELQKELEELANANSGLKRNVDEHLLKIDELVSAHQHNNKELTRSHDSEKKLVQQEVKEAQNDLLRVTEMLSEHRLNVDILTEKNKVLEEALKESQVVSKRSSDNPDEVKRLINENERLQEKNKELRDRNQNLANRLIEMENHHE